MNKILEMKFGSHLYGTNTPESDMDFKAIYIPTAKEIILGNYPKTIQIKRNKKECERNTKDDVDIEVFSLDRFLTLLCDGQTVALDMIFAPEEFITFTDNKWDIKELWYFIKDNRTKLLSKNVNAFVGYARQQAAKYGIKGSRMDALKRIMAFLEPLPDYDRLTLYHADLLLLVKECSELVSLEKTPLLEIVLLKGPDKVTDQPHLHICGRKVPLTSTVKFAKEVYGRILDGYGERATKAHLAGGVDWKALSHAVRVNSEALELLTTNTITFPRPDKDLLTAIKLGKLPYEEVAGLIEQGLADLYVAHEKSSLPDQPDRDFANQLIYSVYSRIVQDE